MSPFIRRIMVAALGVCGAPAAAEENPAPPRPMMVSEAKLPQGFPGPGPVGEVIVKTYPAHRLARVAAGGGSDNGMFMKLFRHIERNEIAMTAPVQMEGERQGMAFFYATPDIGTAGPDPADAAVVVEDVPETTVASVGLRGSYSKETSTKGEKQLRDWLANHPEWQVAGSPRTFGYNSPFVPNFLKYGEVQIPIRRAPPEPAPPQSPPGLRQLSPP